MGRADEGIHREDPAGMGMAKCCDSLPKRSCGHAAASGDGSRVAWRANEMPYAVARTTLVRLIVCHGLIERP